MKKVSLFVVVSLMVVFFSIPVMADVFNGNISIIVNLSKSNFLKESNGIVTNNKVLKEFEKRTGFNFSRDMIFAGILGNINGMVPEAVLFVHGTFNIDKINNELKKEKICMNELKLGGKKVYGSSFREMEIVLTDDFLVAAPKGNKYFATEKSAEAFFESLRKINRDNFFKLSINVSKNIKDLIKHSLSRRTPEIIRNFIDGIKNLELTFNNGKIRLVGEMSDVNSVNLINSSIQSLIGLANMIMNSREKSVMEKMKHVSAFRLFSGKIMGTLNSIAMGRKLLSKLSITTDGNKLKVEIAIPKSLLSSDAFIPIVAATGVIAAIAVPNFNMARKRAKEKACISNMKTIEGADELYGMEHKDFTCSIKELVKGGYLRNMPRCPSGGVYTIMKDKKDGIKIRCSVHGELK